MILEPARRPDPEPSAAVAITFAFGGAVLAFFAVIGALGLSLVASLVGWSWLAAVAIPAGALWGSTRALPRR